jgi:hypothetical protein
MVLSLFVMLFSFPVSGNRSEFTPAEKQICITYFFFVLLSKEENELTFTDIAPGVLG